MPNSSWYNTGTVAATNGSTAITGTGTAWANQVKQGDLLFFDLTLVNPVPAEVNVVNSNTSLTLSRAFVGTTGSGKTYAIVRQAEWGITAALALDVRTYLDSISKITSTSFVVIGTGSKTFATPVLLAYLMGARVRIADQASPTTNWMEGVVTAFAAGSLTVNVDLVAGSGTIGLWYINSAGERGQQGLPGGTATTPGTTVVNNVAAWNNTTGTNLKDSGFALPGSGTVLSRDVDIQMFTATGTWTKPAGAKLVYAVLTGGGGGAGGGGKAATSTAVSGSAGGGGAGRRDIWMLAAELGATAAVTIGAGGPGGAGATSNGAGADGTIGANTVFGGATAYGAGRGGGGAPSTASGGGAGGSGRGPGGNATGATAGTNASSLAGGPGGSGVAGTAGTSTGGGAGGGGCSAAAVASTGPPALGAPGGGCGGGGSGGGVTSANAFQAGGAVQLATSTSSIAGGATDGAAGTAGTTQTQRGASGGSGGAGSVASNGGAGGAGGAPGGGGGGGGGSQGGNGGVGGDGGRGEVTVYTFF